MINDTLKTPEEVYKILRNFNQPDKWEDSAWLSSCLVESYLRAKKSSTPSQAVRDVFSDTLHSLSIENDDSEQILRGRFWKGWSVRKMVDKGCPQFWGERNFYINQEKAIARFATLLIEKDTACQKAAKRQKAIKIWAGIIGSLVFIGLLLIIFQTPPPNLSAVPPTFTHQKSTNTLPPILSPSKKIFLSALTPRIARAEGQNYCVGRDPIGDPPTCNGAPLTRNGTPYPHSLFAHAESNLVFDLNKKYETFGTSIFLWGSRCGDGASFSIELDGIIAYQSPMFEPGQIQEGLKYDVSDIDTLRLQTFMGEDGNYSCDATIWGEPYLITKPSYEDPLSTLPDSNTTRTSPNTKILFQENFDNGFGNEFKNKLGLWTVVSGAGDNNVLDINSMDTSIEYPVIEFGESGWKNFILESRVRIVDYKTSNDAPLASIRFRGNYKVAFTPFWNNIALVFDPPWENIADRTIEIQKKRWYSVRIEANGSEINIFLDNKLVIPERDTRASSGVFGFATWPEAHVQFDDIVIKEK